MTFDPDQLARLDSAGLGNRRIAKELGITVNQARHARLRAKLGEGKVALPEPQTCADFAQRINAAWRKGFEAVIETGRLIAAAKAKVEPGEFLAMVENDLPFTARTAQRLMAIAADKRITDATHVSHLPPHWGTLYELTKLDDDQFQARITDGTIRPEMERRDISTAIKQQQRATRERVLGGIQCALPTKKYGVILADPEWRFEPWSRETGMDRSADNHYPTSCTEVIASRDVASIAAQDCVLFLWATAAMLPHALTVMTAWGFDYRSHLVWIKDKIGTGYWFRNGHELLLVGVRGNVPAPAPGTQRSSWIECGVGAHSAKPEYFLELIEAYFPTLPKIELNRRGPAREGWDAWGNEAEETQG